MSTEENKRIVSNYFQHVSTGDIDAALSLIAPNGTWWMAGVAEKFPPAGLKSREELGEMLTALGKSMPTGLHIVPTAYTAENDRVAVEAENFADLANGKRYSNQLHYLLIVREGLIVEGREYLDTLKAKEYLIDP